MRWTSFICLLTSWILSAVKCLCRHLCPSFKKILVYRIFKSVHCGSKSFGRCIYCKHFLLLGSWHFHLLHCVFWWSLIRPFKHTLMCLRFNVSLVMRKAFPRGLMNPEFIIKSMILHKLIFMKCKVVVHVPFFKKFYRYSNFPTVFLEKSPFLTKKIWNFINNHLVSPYSPFCPAGLCIYTYTNRTPSLL